MSRKFLLIVALIIIIIAFIGIIRNATNDNKQTDQQAISQTPATPTLPPSVPQTVFQLFPNPAQPDSEGNVDIAVSINTNNNKATAAQFTVQYDPSALRFVSIKPEDAFYNAKVVSQNVNEAAGTITYSLELPQQAQYSSVQGNYHIAEIEFRGKGQGTTAVKVVSASVTSPDNAQSVLKSITGTTVKLSE